MWLPHDTRPTPFFMRIMVSCGEPSGDLYAGALATALRRLEPAVDLVGLGGEQFAAAGGRLLGDYRGLAVTGLWEAIKVLPRSLAMFKRLVAAARELRPDVLVAIDYPDFNFRLAKAVHQLGVPVVYYVSPQFWAWRPGRVHVMKQFVARALVIFPFEEPFYQQAGIPVEFVGHPLVDLARAREDREPFLTSLGLDPTRPTIALLPGSRPNELRAIFPVLAKAATLIASKEPRVQFVVARAPNLDTALFAGSPGEVRPPLVTVESRTDDVLASSDVVVTASGTATVQAALHLRPMVIVYRLSPITYTIGRRFVNVSTYGMVNLIAGRKIATELIQDDFTPERVADEALLCLQNPDRASAMKLALSEVVSRLGTPGASERAAAAVLQVARATTKKD